MKKLVFISGACCSSTTLIGWLFKVLHWPYADLLLLGSVSAIALIFIPAYAYYRYQKSEVFH